MARSLTILWFVLGSLSVFGLQACKTNLRSTLCGRNGANALELNFNLITTKNCTGGDA
jgi:hypothetical protein